MGEEEIRRLAVDPIFQPGDRERRIWDRGGLIYHDLAVVRGYVQLLKRIPGEAILFTGRSRINVVFFNYQVPPNVRHGDRITVTGNLETANAGQVCIVKDALLIPEGHTKMMGELSEVIARYIVNPQTYIDREELPNGDSQGIPL